MTLAAYPGVAFPGETYPGVQLTSGTLAYPAGWEFKVISGGQWYPLPDYQSAQISFDFSDIGAIRLAVAKGGINYDKIVNESVVVATWNGVEPYNGRFVIDTGEGTDDNEDLDDSFAGMSLLGIFKTVVLAGLPGAPGERVRFEEAKTGGILNTLLTAAQARGAATGITWDFTSTVDSAGNPWDTTINISYAVGQKYSDIINHLVDQDWVEVRFNGTVLQAFNAGGMGVDRTIGASVIELQHGLDYEEMPRKWTSTERAKYALVIGDKGTVSEYTDATVPNGPFGRKEIAVSQAGANSSFQLMLAGRAAIKKVANIRQQLTRKVKISEGRPFPGVNYHVGDWIRERVAQGAAGKEVSNSAKYRVRGMVVTINGTGATSEAAITLNDKFLEHAIKLSRQVSGILGGGTGDSGGSGVPSTDTSDKTTPVAPSGLLLSSEAYIDTSGRPRAVLMGSWNAPLTNTDGSAITDLAGYVVNYRRGGTTVWQSLSTPDTNFVIGELETNRTYEVRVQALDNANPPHRSAWSGTSSHLTQVDTTPPPIPSTPTTAVRLGTVTVKWDGLNESGGGMPPDFSHIEVHRSQGNNFTPVAGTRIGNIFATNGSINLPDQAYNTTWYYKFVAVDTTGNKSTGSAQASAVTSPLVNADIIGKILDGAKLIDQSVDGDSALAVGSVSTSRLDVGALQVNLQPNGNFEEADPADPTRPAEWAGSFWTGAGVQTISFETANPIFGTRSMRLNYASDADRQAFIVSRARFPVTEGDKYLVKAKFRASRAVTGKNVILQVVSAATEANVFTLGSNTFTTIDSKQYTSANTELKGVFTVPAGHKFMAMYLTHEAPADGGGSYVLIWDEASIQKQIVSAVIADGQVTTPLLAALAVVTDKLAANAVTFDKMDVGAVHAENIRLGTFASNIIPDPSLEEDYDIDYWDVFAGHIGNVRQWRRSGEPADWEPGTIVDRVTDFGRSGKKSLRIYAPAGKWPAAVTGAFPLETGKTYRLLFHATSRINPAQMAIAIHAGSTETAPWYYNDITTESDIPVFSTIPLHSTDGWTSCSYEFTVTDPTHKWAILEISNPTPSANAELIIDDASIVEVGVGGTEITAAGIRVFGPDGLETCAFVSNRPNVLSISKDGATVASISQEGVVSSVGLSIAGTDVNADGVADQGVEIYGTEFLEWLESRPKGTIAYGQNTTVNSFIAGEQPFMQLDCTIKTGRIYKVEASGFASNDTTNGRILMRLRYTTDGSVPGITSPQLQLWRSPPMYTGTGSLPFYLTRAVGSPGDGTEQDLRVLLTHAPEGSGLVRLAGAAANPTEMWITDMGPIAIDTGIDRVQASPPATKKTYVKTYKSLSSGTYKGDGTKRTNTTDVVQGYYGSNGNGKGLWTFPSMTADLSGAAIQKLEIYVYANHWYYNNGGTARIHCHGYSAVPASSPTMTYVTQSTGWPKPGGRWVTLPSSVHASFANGTYKGIGMGPGPTTSQTYYGRFNGTAGSALIRATYVK